ncbi:MULTISPECIES: CARDB domain-containing protein [Clostridium]|uniref:CARDB domain-containing protein n=1 Tax=Clostridium TaxID=1485 RepID=UPI000824C7FE|nr:MULTISPECIES: CARDB domain-containing protein [Clostridium]PJI10503.1 hypothetical protein CUB90_00480 [Clostridium sp. CT7]
MAGSINTVNATGANIAEATGSAQAVEVITTADTTLTVTLETTATRVLVNNPVTYTITVKNTGTATAQAVQFSDVIDTTYFTFGTVTSPNNELSYDATSHSVIGSLGDITATTSVVVTVTLTGKAATPTS